MELLGLLLEEGSRVVAPVVICPLSFDVLPFNELGHFVIACILPRFLEVLGQSLLEVRVYHVIAEVLEQLYLTLWPLVQINRFDLGDVHSKLPMYTYFACKQP